nr:hypothetical protein [Tanacetum cinerariifolium]
RAAVLRAATGAGGGFLALFVGSSGRALLAVDSEYEPLPLGWHHHTAAVFGRLGAGRGPAGAAGGTARLAAV